MKICNKLSNIITKFIVLFLICITGYLFFVSIFSTVYVSEFENIYYIKDTSIVNIISLILIITTLYLLKNKIESLITGNEDKMVIFNSVGLSVILLFIILSTRLYPLYDQAKILNVIKNMWTFNYTDFMPGGYINKCDNQKGITLYFYFLTLILKKISVTAIQVLNSLYIVISNIFIYKSCSLLFDKKKSCIMHFVICMYAPEWLYATFVYGIIPSYLFGIISVYYFIKLINNKNSKKCNIKYSLLLSLSLSLSIILKTNSVIIMIAIILLSGYFFIIQKEKYKYLLNIFFIIIFYFISVKSVDYYYTSLTGLDMNIGIPRTAHMAMALIDNNDKGPGWYNGYTAELYEKNNYDKEKTSTEAIENISVSLNNYKNNPASFVSFISRKIISQWNEPTFESLYILYGRDSLNEMPGWVIELTNPTSITNRVVRKVFDIAHLIILFGAFSYFVLTFNEIKINELIYGIIIIGGFLFHIFWEAKSQYIIIYFLMFIPYCVLGYMKVVNGVQNIFSEVKEKKTFVDLYKNKDCSKYITYVVTILAIYVLISAVSDDGIIGKLLKPSFKTEEYKMVTSSEYNKFETAGKLDEEYAESLNMPKLNLRKKKCNLYLSDNEKLVLSVKNKEDNSIGFCDITDDNIDRSVLLFDNSAGETSIRFRATGKVLDTANGVIKEGNLLQQWDYNGDKGQCFNLKNIDNDRYIITNGDLALGLDENENIILTNIENAAKLKIK